MQWMAPVLAVGVWGVVSLDLQGDGVSRPCATEVARGLSTRRPTQAASRLRLMPIPAAVSAPGGLLGLSPVTFLNQVANLSLR